MLALEEARSRVVDLGQLGLGLGGLGPAHVLLERGHGDDREDAEDRDDDHQLDERETLGVLELLNADLFHVLAAFFLLLDACLLGVVSIWWGSLTEVFVAHVDVRLEVGGGEFPEHAVAIEVALG